MTEKRVVITIIVTYNWKAGCIIEHTGMNTFSYALSLLTVLRFANMFDYKHVFRDLCNVRFTCLHHVFSRSQVRILPWGTPALHLHIHF
jgi:hypothetical protein